MRYFKSEKNTFRFTHYTYNQNTNKESGLRIVEEAFVRRSLPDEVFAYDSDLYLTYVDNEIGEPRQCFKSLINTVSFPPKFVEQKVFIDEYE